MCKARPKGLRKPKTKITLLPGILILILLCAACGKRRTVVRPPAERPAASAQEAASAKSKDSTKPGKTPPTGASAKTVTVEHTDTEKEVPFPTTSPASGPVIRIGLTTSAREVRVSSSGKFYMIEKRPEATRKLLKGEVRIRIEREGSATAEVYQVQVASLAKQKNAQNLKKKLSGKLSEPVFIRHNASAGTYQVRVGAFPEKKDAESLLKTLAHSGFPDAFLATGKASAGGGNTILAVRGSGNFFHLSEAGVLFQASTNPHFLCVDGTPYRGFLDIIPNAKGRITVINRVGMEDYLLGVVPAEISPSAYPEHDGLAAMSIAARTYALYHMGKYQSEGFDLSNDTRTQVYLGVEAETPATSEAVRRTKGLAVYYQGKVINAMYTSTCGGRTEDFSNVYDTEPVPYLKSVSCTVEAGPLKDAVILKGKQGPLSIITADDGSIANRDLQLARVLKLIPLDSETSPEFYSAAAEPEETVRWIESARKLALRPSGNSAALKNINTRAGFLRFAAESFFGADEIQRKISRSDVDYYLGNLEDGSAVSEPARYALAYLMKHELWRPCADNTARPEAPIRRCDAVAVLLRWIESVRPEILRRGTFVADSATRDGNDASTALRVKWGNHTREFPLSENAALFRLDSGRTTPVSSLRMIGNEKIAFHVQPSGMIDFLEMELNPTGASSDRYSPAAEWEVRIPRAELAKKLRSLTGSIGELLDLKPARLGNSGRVVQIEVLGSLGSVALLGYTFRGASGLKDTLFTIKRERHPDGSIAAFIFDGRGFGHGVGLCQVGAFGMAKAGKSYEEILKHYYTGVEIRRAY
jgi:stage II sporulation protein D